MPRKYVKGVYALHFPNGKRYIGIGVGKRGIHLRWLAYKSLSCKLQPKLHNALVKYGPENVVFEVVLETEDAGRAKRAEMLLISLLDTQNNGYNSSPGGDCFRLGVTHTPEARAKIGAASRNRVVKDSTRLKCKQNATAQFSSPEARKRLSDRMLGIKRSAETRKKIGDIQRGRKQSAETVAKRSLAIKAACSTPEARARLGALGRGRVKSQEEKLKLSNAAKLQWQLARLKNPTANHLG